MECWCEYLYLIKIVFFRWRSIDEIYAIKPSFYPIVLILWTEREYKKIPKMATYKAEPTGVNTIEKSWIAG